MPEINLTSRKKSLPDKVLGTFIKDRDKNNNIIYKARYSDEYREAGHDFNKSFKVLRGDYWFKYELLDQDDIATYETLQFLCEAEIPFTLEVLAERMGINRGNEFVTDEQTGKEKRVKGKWERGGIGKSTLRQRLDNLENAELLEVIKTDAQGTPNYYILRTPFFCKAEFKESQQARVLREYDELPTSFLEDHVERLRKNIRKNRARKLREFARNDKAKNRFTELAKQLKSDTERRLLIWHKILKTFKKSAAEIFDSIVWTLCHDKDLLQLYGTEFFRVFKAKLKAQFVVYKMNWNEFYFDLANELRAFYDPRLDVDRPSKVVSIATQAPDTTGAAVPMATTAEEKEEIREALRRTFREKRDKRILPTNSTELKNSIANLIFGSLTFKEALDVISEFFSPETWQRLTVELRE